MTAIQTLYNLADISLAEVEEASESWVETEGGCEVWGRGDSKIVASPGTNPTKNIKEKRCQRRAKRRELLAQANGGFQRLTVKRAMQRRISSIAEDGSLTFTVAAREGLKAAEGGWLGSRAKTPYERERTLLELANEDLQLVEWDGIAPHALLDASGHVVAVLAGRAGGTFEDVLLQVAYEFEQQVPNLLSVEESVSVLPRGKQPARGHFHSVVTGISHGNGQKEPTQSAVPAMYQKIVRELAESNAMRRLAGFQNQAFKSFFPKIHAYYENSLSKLYCQRSHLRRPYENSIMPAAAYNLGPVTVCRPHRDSANLSFGICAITALGHFNPKTGGHLVLRELGVIVEFPPGATALIPSAIITHYNTKIMEEETRYSFTQYASGSLFSYIENGMKTEKEVVGSQNLPTDERLRHAEGRRGRWKAGLAFFPHISEYGNHSST